MSEIEQYLRANGWLERAGIQVHFGQPRLGWKPEDGTLIIGWHEYPQKVTDLNELINIIKNL